jgi:hypothetical protein
LRRSIPPCASFLWLNRIRRFAPPKYWPKSELRFCSKFRWALFPTDLCTLWVRRIDHLSDPSQSATASRQVSAKIARRPVHIHPAGTPYKAVTEKQVHFWKTLKCRAFWGGGTGNVHEKTGVGNCSGSAGPECHKCGIRLRHGENSQSGCRNSCLPLDYLTSVLGIWTCDLQKMKTAWFGRMESLCWRL